MEGMRALRHIASFVSWHRRWIGALLAAGSVLLVAQSLAEPPPTTAVVVLATAVEAGHRIEPADVEIREALPGTVPESVFTDAAAAVGRTSAIALAQGTALHPAVLELGHQVEVGRAVVPIAVPDNQLRSLLRPGNPVTLVMVGGEAAEVLTRDARISALPQDDGGGGMFAAASSQSGGLVLVDVPVEQAPTVAALGQSGQLSIILGGG